MTSTISPALFYFFAVIMIASALGMAVSRNLFRTALLMLVTFASVAGIYASMHERFLAVAQLLVYVGAITILMIFGIMLTKSYGVRTLTNPFSRTAIGGGNGCPLPHPLLETRHWRWGDCRRALLCGEHVHSHSAGCTGRADCGAFGLPHWHQSFRGTHFGDGIGCYFASGSDDWRLDDYRKGG